MSELNPTTMDSTINILQQDLNTVDTAVALALIEQWENQLQETEIFTQLSELKQAILNGNTSPIPELLNGLAQSTSTDNAFIREQVPDEMEAQVSQISELLSRAGQGLS